MRNEKNTKFYKRLIKFGRKNQFCRFAAFPLLFFYMLAFRAVFYCGSNRKRLSVMAVSLLLFGVYSSFSFPVFVSGSNEQLNDVLLDQDVELAKETPVDMDSMELLEDKDVMEGSDTAQTAHGISIEDKYDVSDILEASASGSSKPDSKDVRKEPSDTVTFEKDDWRLVLINKQHSIPEDYTFTLGTIMGNLRCDERIIDDLMEMFRAAKEDNVSLQICSPYRDMERQVMLFNRKIERYMNRGMSYMEAYQLSSRAVTVPGASEHQIGLALDIVCPSYVTLDEGFGDTEAGKWLAENSCEYGFILRYPKDKEYITGISYEPWHFRYVGRDAARLITGQGITLEEFWEEYLDYV